MSNLRNNKYLAYLALYALYLLQWALGLISRVQRIDIGRNKKNIYIALTVMYAGFIFYLSSQSQLNLPSSPFDLPILDRMAALLAALGLDSIIVFAESVYRHQHMPKLAHVGIYFILGILLHLTFRNSEKALLRRYPAIFAFAIGILYGISDEIHQSFVPGRTPSVIDVVANGIGLVLAQIILLLFFIIYLHRIRQRADRD